MSPFVTFMDISATYWVAQKKDTDIVKIRFEINSIKNTMKHTINRYLCV